MIGANIRKFRLHRNITQDELADKLNVTRQAVSKWECNKTEPNMDIVCKIADVLDVTIEELLRGVAADKHNESVRILNVTKEDGHAVRLIGKRYNGNAHFRTKWREWHENGWFAALEKMGSHYKNDKAYIGAKRIVNGMLEYWIGMLFLPETDVPDDFEFIDIDAADYAVFRLNGKATEVTTFETHCRCLDKLSQYGLTRDEDHWCFERHSSTDFCILEVDRKVIIDYCVSIV